MQTWCSGRRDVHGVGGQPGQVLGGGDAVGEFGERARGDDLVDLALQRVVFLVAQGHGRGDAEDGAAVCEGGGEAGEAVGEAVRMF